MLWQSVLPLLSQDQLPRPCTTLLVKGVDGYRCSLGLLEPDDFLLYEQDTATGNPAAIAVNGPRAVSWEVTLLQEFCMCAYG